MSTFLSIVMPVYGVEKFIAGAIESVIHLPFRDWELIIVDDGSEDKSISIAEQYARHDKRLKIYSKPNGGLSDARNFGLIRASGRYVMFLDSDDRINGYDFNLLREGSLHCDIIIFSYANVTATINNEVLTRTPYSATPGEWIKGKSDYSLAYSNLRFLNFAWNKIYSLNFLNSNNLFFRKGLSLIEDIDFNSRAFKCCNTIRFIDFALVDYYSRPLPTLSTTMRANLMDLLIERKRLYNSYFETFKFPLDKSAEMRSFFALEDYRYYFRTVSSATMTDSDKLQLIKSVLQNAKMREDLHYPRSCNFKTKAIYIMIRFYMSVFLKKVYSRR